MNFASASLFQLCMVIHDEKATEVDKQGAVKEIQKRLEKEETDKGNVTVG